MLMALPKITVVTVVYNRVNTIEQAISSVVNQTYPNLEYIVIDGGSTDGTVDIIKKYEKRISYWVSEKDNGIYDAMNKGVRVATGEYVEFLNSDDCFYSEDILEKVAKELDAETDILSCRACVVDEETLVERVIGDVSISEKKNYHGGMVISHQGMFTRRNLLIKYPFDTKYKIKGDYKFFLSCFLDEDVRFKFNSIPVVYFSNGGISGKVPSMMEEFEIDNEIGKAVNESRKRRLIKFIQWIIGEPLYLMIREITWGWVRDKLQYKLGKKHSCENKICRWCGREG